MTSLMLTVCPCSSHSLLSCNLHRKSGHLQSLRLADTAISAFATTFSAANSSSEVDQKFFLAFVVLVDISRSHPVHTSFLFIRFSMRFGRFSERFLLCERGASRQSQSPYNVFLSGCCYYRAKSSLGRNVSIFMKRETLQKRHKQSNKHVFRVCMHSYMYITKVT